MQTRLFPSSPDLIERETGGMIPTVPPGQANRATVHATVSEF
jgi:hypothetical protein